MSIYDLTWRQWCGVFALAILAAVVVGRAAWVLMGRHEQPRGKSRLRDFLDWAGDFWDWLTADRVAPLLADDNGEAIGDLLPDVPGHGTGDPSPLPAVPGHHHGEPVDLGFGAAWDLNQPTDDEIAAQWQADHDAMAAEDRCIHCGSEIDHYLGCPQDPDPDYEAEDEARRVQLTPVDESADTWAERADEAPQPGVVLRAAIVQGQTVILDGQPSPFLVRPEEGELLEGHGWVRGRDFLEYEPLPDDTLIDLRPEPRASHALWRQAAPSRADWYTQLMALRPAWYVTGGAA